MHAMLSESQVIYFFYFYRIFNFPMTKIMGGDGGRPCQCGVFLS